MVRGDVSRSILPLSPSESPGVFARPVRANHGPSSTRPIPEHPSLRADVPSFCENLQSKSLFFHFAKRNSGLVRLVCQFVPLVFCIQRTVHAPRFKTRTAPLSPSLISALTLPERCGPISGTRSFRVLPPFRSPRLSMANVSPASFDREMFFVGGRALTPLSERVRLFRATGSDRSATQKKNLTLRASS